MSEEVKVEETVDQVKEATVELETVEKAVEEAVAQNKDLTDENQSLKEAATKADEELAAIKADLEQVKAKHAAPAFISTKSENKMEAKEEFGIFLKEGVEGLRKKAGDMQISTDAQGGYSLPEELRRNVIELMYEQSPLRQVCSVTTAETTDIKQLVGIGDAASGWVGETTTRGVTDSPELAQRTATFGEIYARPLVYAHMLEDAFIDTEAYVMQEVARQFSEQQGVAFLSGDGTNKPTGILNGVTLGSNGAVNNTTGAFQVAHSAADGSLGATASDTFDFLRSVVRSVKSPYLPGCVWMMNRATHEVLVALQNADAEYYMQRDVTQASADRLFGYQILINEDMDNIPATTGDAAPILFGDFAKSFQIIDRVGMSMLQNPYSQMGAISYYTRARVGSLKLNAETLKVVSVSKA